MVGDHLQHQLRMEALQCVHGSAQHLQLSPFDIDFDSVHAIKLQLAHDIVNGPSANLERARCFAIAVDGIVFRKRRRAGVVDRSGEEYQVLLFFRAGDLFDGDVCQAIRCDVGPQQRCRFGIGLERNHLARGTDLFGGFMGEVADVGSDVQKHAAFGQRHSQRVPHFGLPFAAAQEQQGDQVAGVQLHIETPADSDAGRAQEAGVDKKWLQLAEKLGVECPFQPEVGAQGNRRRHPRQG